VNEGGANYGRVVAAPPSPTLSLSQLPTLAKLGEERTAKIGDVLYRVRDRRYSFVAILEGEVAIIDDAGNEIIRLGASGFRGELNLLPGQTVLVTVVVTQPLQYIAVDRDALQMLDFARSNRLPKPGAMRRESVPDHRRSCASPAGSSCGGRRPGRSRVRSKSAASSAGLANKNAVITILGGPHDTFARMGPRNPC